MQSGFGMTVAAGERFIRTLLLFDGRRATGGPGRAWRQMKSKIGVLREGSGGGPEKDRLECGWKMPISLRKREGGRDARSLFR